jgi:hypothetical protein
MTFLVDAMHKGGPFMWLLLLLLLAAPLPPLVGAVLLGLRRRAPAALFWLVPGLLVLAGAVGRIQGQIMASEAVAHASVETQSLMLHAGLGVAAYTEFAGWGLAALALWLSAPMVGLALLVGAGEGARWRILPALAGLGGGLLGLLVAVGVAFLQLRATGPSSALWCVPALALSGGVAMGLAAARGNEADEHGARLAAGRLLVLALVLGSLLTAGLAGVMNGFIQVHEAVAHAAPESRAALMATGTAMMASWVLPSLAALVMVGLGGLAASLSGLRHLTRPGSLISAAVLSLGLLVVALGPAYASYQSWQLAARTAERHLATLLEGQRALPRATRLGEDAADHHPLQAFERSLRWRGSAWQAGSLMGGVADDWELPLEDEPEAPVLLVAPADLSAATMTGTPWTSGTALASLLVATSDGLETHGGWGLGSSWLASASVGSVRMDWIPAAAWPTSLGGEGGARGIGELLEAGAVPEWEDVVFLQGSGGGVSLHRLATSLQDVVDVEQGMAELYRGDERPEDLTVVLIPGAGWTLQDMVSHCLSASVSTVEVDRYGWELPRTRCAFTPALPLGLEAQRAADRAATRPGGARAGGFGGLDARGDGAMEGGSPAIMGSLDKSVIQQVVKRHSNMIRYCYQRELAQDPDLSGKIVVKFVIAADGTVSSSSVKSSTMGNAIVEACVAKRFQSLLFPEPLGGGIVIVSYPFVFQPAN